MRASCRCIEKPNATESNQAYPALVTQENHYDPWGVAIEQEVVADKTKLPSFELRDRITYNGKELQGTLNYLDYGARMYDATIGRWGVVDPLSEKNNSISGFVYTCNNPLLFIDPIGLDTFRITRNSIQVIPSSNGFHTYFFTNSKGVESNLGTYKVNDEGLVQFPASGEGFSSYGDIQKSGHYGNEYVGSGDHFLTPDAAGLFGVVNTLNDEKNFKIELGDMSTSNGSDPTWRNEKGVPKHHGGHGHNGNRSGMDIDFRYVDRSGQSFQSADAPNSKKFSVENNRLIYDTAKRFGFNVNYQGKSGPEIGGKRIDGHNNHGHLGYGLKPINVIKHKQ